MGVGEEAAQTTLQITSKAALITADVILEAIRALNNILVTRATTTKVKSNNINSEKDLKSGKQPLKYLSKQNVALDSIPVSNIDIKQMTAQLKRYGIDFSVVKNRQTNDFNLFFKGTDTAAISNALEQVVGERSSDKEESKKPLKEQKDKAQQKADKQNAEKAAEKAKAQEQQKNRSGREQDR